VKEKTDAGKVSKKKERKKRKKGNITQNKFDFLYVNLYIPEVYK
jgi:hypothetical protein